MKLQCVLALAPAIFSLVAAAPATTTSTSTTLNRGVKKHTAQEGVAKQHVPILKKRGWGGNSSDNDSDNDRLNRNSNCQTAGSQPGVHTSCTSTNPLAPPPPHVVVHANSHSAAGAVTTNKKRSLESQTGLTRRSAYPSDSESDNSGNNQRKMKRSVNGGHLTKRDDGDGEGNGMDQEEEEEEEGQDDQE